MQMPAGTRLQGGKYEIVRFISSGGFGCTYEAKHAMLNKSVAIKEFFVKDFCNRDSTTNSIYIASESKVSLIEKLRGKFVAEAQALFDMHHQNIVRVTDIFEENNTAYYVMDFISGPSLAGLIGERGALPEKEAVGYIRQVADALKYVHSLNRLHLDIKPQNIMINSSGDAILIDFGVSKQYDEVSGENTSTLVGSTPGYAPIEQNGANLTIFSPASDIYALGATLYKALTGVTPPPASLIASGESLERLPETFSAPVRRAVEAAMQIPRNKRPQNIDEFLALLDGDNRAAAVLLGGETVVAATSDTVIGNNEKEVVKKETPNDPARNNGSKSLGAERRNGNPPPKKNGSSGVFLLLLLFLFIAAGVFLLINNGDGTKHDYSVKKDTVGIMEQTEENDVHVNVEKSEVDSSVAMPQAEINIVDEEIHDEVTKSPIVGCPTPVKKIDKQIKIIDEDWEEECAVEDLVDVDCHTEVLEVVEETEEEEIFLADEQQASFPGGMQKMWEFVRNNLKYPAVSRNNGSQGRVILRFKVLEDGRIDNITIIKSSGDSFLDDEAIRVVSLMPNWIPARQNGMNVFSLFTLPINFTLQ
ncbi:MAG: TonB family protein [Bacteroidaceae bacterium]|nr:TonB family protein [Bacteroidaceae bacterium]